MTERYRAPGYRHDRVAHRYVRRISPTMYRVYECVARKEGKNRVAALQALGAGATIREYDLRADGLPSTVVRQLSNMAKGRMVAWP